MTMTEAESRISLLEAEVARLKQLVEEGEDGEAAVEEGLAEIERGEGAPAVAAVRELGRRYGLERP